MTGGGADLATLTMLVACGAGLASLALCIVFSGLVAERRLRDRLEDIETRALQMATLRRVERLGKLPSLDRLLWRWFPNASSIRQKLAASGTDLTLGDYCFIAISIAVGVAFVLCLVLDLAPGTALAGSLPVGIGLPNAWVGWRARKRGQMFNLLFPEAIDLIVRALRAGLPLQEAVGSVARGIKDPVGGIFQSVQQEVQLGTAVEAALWRAAKTVQTDELNFLIVAMSIQRDTGGNLAETLTNLSALLRARQQLRLKIRAFTSEARTTMLIMVSLPFLVGGGLYLMSPGYMGLLFTTAVGKVIVAFAGCSMGIGIFMMNKIATIRV